MKRGVENDDQNEGNKKVRSDDRPVGFTEFRFLIEKKHQGLLIGKGGAKIQNVREQSGVIASILKVADPSPAERILTLQGTVEQCATAWRLFGEVIVQFQQEQAEKSGTEPNDTFTVKILCDQSRIGAVIGKGGATIRQTQAETEAKIQCSNDPLPGSTEKTVNISTTTQIMEHALVVVLMQLRDYPLRPGTTSTQFVPGAPAAVAAPAYGAPYNPYANAAPSDPYSSQAGYPTSYPGYGMAPPAPSGGSKHTQRIVIPTMCAGGVIGKRGSRIREIQQQSGCTVRIADATEESPSERVVSLEGSNEGIQIAIQLIRIAVEASAVPQQ